MNYEENYEFFLNKKRILETRINVQKYILASNKSDLPVKVKKSKYVRDYINVLNNLRLMDNPVDKDISKRIAEIKAKKYNVKLLEASCDSMEFEDGISIKAWLKSLLKKFGNIEDFQIKKDIIELCEFLCRDILDGSLRGKVINNLFALRLLSGLDYSEFAGMLNVPIYTVKMTKQSVELLSKRNIIRVRNSLENGLSIEDTVINDYILNILDLLKQYELTSNMKVKKVKIKINKKEDNSCVFSLKVIKERFEWLKNYLLVNNLRDIPPTLKFPHGGLVKEWFYQMSNISEDSLLLDEEKAYIKKEIYEVSLILTRDALYKKPDYSHYNYGPIFKAFAFNVGLNNGIMIGIPNSIFKSVLNNDLYPNEKFLLTMKNYALSFRGSDKENELVINVIKLCEKMTEELRNVDRHNIADYFVYTLDNLEAYENAFAIDKSILDKVKVYNYDWYLKCLTLGYILKTTHSLPNRNSYFYDGSIIAKWLTTQNRTLSVNNGCREFCKEQMIMLNIILDEKNRIVETTSREYSINMFMQENFDLCIQKIAEIMRERKSLPTDEDKLNNYSLLEIWRLINNFLKQKDSFLSVEQIKEAKRLIHLYLELSREKKSLSIDDSFGLLLIEFLSDLNITFEKFSELAEISIPTIMTYSLNRSFPRVSTVKKIMDGIDKIDKSKLREDQLLDIANFKEKLEQFSQDNLAKKRVVFSKSFFNKILSVESHFSNTGNMRIDVGEDVYDRVLESNPEWLKEALEAANYYLNVDVKGKVGISNFKWYVDSVRYFKNHKLSSDQVLILKYVCSLSANMFYKRKVSNFIRKFDNLEEFVYKNNRIPQRGEYVTDETDYFMFFSVTRDVYLGFSRPHIILLDEYLERMANILYIHYLSSRNPKALADSISNGKLRLGNHLTYLRLCLRLSEVQFLHLLGWPMKGMAVYFNNFEPFTDEQIDDIKRMLKEFNINSLQAYQIKAINDFLEILEMKELSQKDSRALALINNDK